MTDMDRVWAYGRIIRQIWNEGQKTKLLLAGYKDHCIVFVPKKKQAAGKGGKD